MAEIGDDDLDDIQVAEPSPYIVSQLLEEDEHSVSAESLLQHPLLMKVADAFLAMLADPKMEKRETRTVLETISQEHEAIRALMEVTPVHPNRRRGGMLPLPPSLSEAMVAAHRDLYMEAVFRLLTTDQTDLLEKFAPALPTLRAASVAALESLFVADGNPIHVWRGYRVCRSGKMPVPEWILAYMDGCASELENLVREPPEEKVAIRIVEAFDLQSGRGPGNKLSAIADAIRDARIFIAVERRIAKGDVGVDAAIGDVVTKEKIAGMMGVESTTKIYRRVARKNGAAYPNRKGRKKGSSPSAP